MPPHHLPMQNCEKMTSSRSSTSTAPEIRPSRSAARRRSSARNSRAAAVSLQGRVQVRGGFAQQFDMAQARRKDIAGSRQQPLQPFRSSKSSSSAIPCPVTATKPASRSVARILRSRSSLRVPGKSAFVPMRLEIGLASRQHCRSRPSARRTASIKRRTRSAVSARRLARSMPIVSTLPASFRMPAVSVSRTFDAVEVERQLDKVAGRAGFVGDDRRVAAGQGIQQAGFSGIGRTDDDDVKSVADDLGSVIAADMRANFGEQLLACPPRRCRPPSRARRTRRRNPVRPRSSPGHG